MGNGEDGLHLAYSNNGLKWEALNDNNVIDGAFIKEKEKYVLFLKDETKNPPRKNIRIATSNKLTDDYSKPTSPITGDYWAEGPTPLKIDDSWIVYFDKSLS